MNKLLFIGLFATLSIYAKVIHLHNKALNPSKSFTYLYDNGMNATATLNQLGNGYKPCDPTVKQYSGYLEVDSNTDKNYFFWAFEAKKSPETAPVVLWMTGGPGCSSELAVVKENGPCHVNDNLTVSPNPYSWNNVATMVYIDQPAGVGFSYSNGKNPDTNEEMVGQDMYAFVQVFLESYPKFRNNEFFVVGESYGGHYAPATAFAINNGNQKKLGKSINLKGLSTGNGMVNPTIQFQYYAPYAYYECKNLTGEPCVTKQVYESMVSNIPQCVKITEECNKNGDVNLCTQAMNSNACMSQIIAYDNTGRNVYDIKKPCVGPLCYDFDNIKKFFNLRSVQLSLGVLSRQAKFTKKWELCNMNVHSDFTADFMRSYSQDIPLLLENGIRVMVYAGDLDFICNWLGNRAWTHALPWAKKAQC